MRNIVKYIAIVSFAAFFSLSLQAQDTQYSQYYNAPLYLNPAFTGMGLDTRVGVNYRMQWPGLKSPFRSYSFWADHNIIPAKSGIGLLVTRDEVGNSGISSTEMSVLYSYEVQLDNDWTFKPGIQLGLCEKSPDFAALTFGDQLSNNGSTGVASVDPFSTTTRNIVYPDISAGGLLYNKNLWIGVSAHHLNRPNQAFNAADYNTLPVKASVQAGYKFLFGGPGSAFKSSNSLPEKSITPTFNYKRQGHFDQLDAGVYLKYEPFMLGMWYRGIPIKHYAPGFGNTEAIILMAGMDYKNMTIGYSYDITLSRLALVNSAGVHEISIVYEFVIFEQHIKKRRGSIPCPNFNKRYKSY